MAEGSLGSLRTGLLSSRAPFSQLHHYPKAPPPNTIAFSVRNLTHCGDTSVQSVVLDHLPGLVRDTAESRVVDDDPIESLCFTVLWNKPATPVGHWCLWGCWTNDLDAESPGTSHRQPVGRIRTLPWNYSFLGGLPRPGNFTRFS